VRPDEIVDRWSDELLTLMADKLSERKKREKAAHEDGQKSARGGKRIGLSDFMGMV